MVPLTRIRTSFPFLVLAAGVLAFADAANSQETCEPVVAQIVSLQGQVEIQRAGTTSWTRVERLATRLCEGDRLRSGTFSRAALLVSGQALLRIDQNTALGLRASPDEIHVEFDSGRVYSISRFPRRFRILTPFVNAGVEGTEFMVTQGRDQAEIAVYEGRVAAEDRVGEPGARQVLQSGQAARFARGAAPAVRALVNPTDAVQWALYYPPLDPEPTGAGALLRLGRVDDAEREIQATLASPGTDALALGAIIRVVKNDKQAALDLAQQAVSRDAKSARAWLALSYAQQAHFRLDDALASASEGVKLAPASAVAEARRAELLLSMGRIEDAEAAAREAVRADPADSRARTVLGFAQLARLDTAAARPELEQAAALDPSDPLPRLGLGLAAIKDGKLAEGRTEIETAVALDPQNALLRSYLGKAYSDELRDELAGTQLERAKQLDPGDPTPWFYNAIRLQALNRPGEALEELQESIERNDNRAVYRSRLRLDQDQAARSASLARIYSDLGFSELALTQARQAISGDPASFAAHRFLAEAYQQQPGAEIARISEVLQSQLLQPVNAAPLAPQLQQIRSPVLPGSGPVTPSFQEFNPLFARDRHAFSLSGVAGSNDTWSDEILYGYYRGRRSFQLGQYHYETDGFRENADLRQDIYRAFYQEDLNAQTSIQAELSYGETEAGDTRFQFEPGSFSPAQRGQLEVTALRAGARHSWNPASLLLGSLIVQKRKARFADKVVDPTFQVDFDISSEIEAYTAELQYQGRGNLGDVIAGVGLFEQRETGSSTTTVTLIGPPIPPFSMTVPLDAEPHSENAYVYGYLGRPWRARLVVGLSVDSVDNENPAAPRSDTHVNPKLGAILPVGGATTVRLVALRATKRLPAVSATIEPTQVAGFNQVFDDLDQTRFWRYGAAIDHNWARRVFGGVELSRRELEVPATIAGVRTKSARIGCTGLT
jgi:tetratricopeptide (TPR) repeat protein